jgi:hypothetical protein
MGRRKAATLPDDWEVSTEVTINGRQVSPGTELQVSGERGRFRFIRQVTRPERGITWLDVWGGPKGSENLRAFRPERVRTVHRINRTDKNVLAERKAS